MRFALSAFCAAALLCSNLAQAANDETFSAHIKYDNLNYPNPYHDPSEDTARSGSNLVHLVSGLEWAGPARFTTYALAHSAYFGTMNVETRSDYFGRVTAESVYEKEIKNYGGDASLNFHFNMRAIFVEVGAWSPNPSTHLGTGYAAEVFLNGQKVWDSSFEMYNDGQDNANPQVIQRGEDMHLTANWHSDRGYFYTGSFGKELNLGLLRSNETAHITYRLSTFSDWNAPDTCFDGCAWAHTSVDDPADATLARVTLTPVPEAETWSMLAGGLLMLGALARRRRQA